MADARLSDFLSEFIRLWESQLSIDWDVVASLGCLSDEGPHLSLLPDEFLPSLDRHLYHLKSQMEQEISTENLSSFTKALKVVVILSRNLDNIPFIASCQLVTSCVTVASHILSRRKDVDNSEGIESVVLVCLLLEILYDPYFSYRKTIVNQTVDVSKIKYQPALLHVEVVPFIYECFQHSKADSIPVVAHGLLYLFGAIMKGAQHNATKAIAPSTVQLLQRALFNSRANIPVARSVLHCQIVMVHTLLNSRPDQCQIEIGEVMEIYQNTLGLLANNNQQDESNSKQTELLCHCIQGIARFLQHRRRESLQILLARTGVVDFLLMLLFDAKLSPEEKRVLVVSIIRAISAVVAENKQAQELVSSSSGYQKLFEALKSLGQPTRQILDALVAMALGREESSGEEEERMVRNVEPVACLVNWLPAIEDQELQIYLASTVNKICSSSLQSKALCCQKGLLMHTISILESHTKLNLKSIQQILRLVQSLGSHSITAAELKLLLRLMRDSDGGEGFPYSAYVLHCLSSMAKKDAACPECYYYFDIQHESEGIVVADITQWQNPGNGLSVCTWIRLDGLEDPGSTSANFRRQLFNISSSKGHGFEAFFLSDGTLVAGVTWKKEYTTAMVHNVILNDHQWHSVCISFSPSRRLFGQSQISIYVDGTARLTVNVRLPPTNENFSSLTIGAPVPSTNEDPSSPNRQESSSPYSLPRKKSDIRSPIGAVRSPNYFSLPISFSSLKTSNDPIPDPEVRVIPLGNEDSIWGRPTCLHGQLGLFALLHDSLTPQNVKTFHDAGANSMSIWSNEDVLMDTSDFYSKVAVCLSARSYHNAFCMDLSPNHQFDGRTKAPVCTTWDVKEVLGCIGGVPALFPILETVVQNDPAGSNVLISGPLMTPTALEKPEVDGWEVLPSSTYSDWKLEQNPVSGFLSLLRNVLHRHSNNIDQLMQGSNIAIIGILMQKVNPTLIDVQVLMAVQLLIEFARDAQDPSLLQSLYQHLLFDMRIWCRSQFHVRIGHVQYLSNLVREDRLSFRKKYGVQYLLDVIKQHYQNSNSGSLIDPAPILNQDLSPDDKKTMRQALLGIVKLYITKEVTAGDVSAIMNFLWSVRDNEMIIEMLDVILNYVESKNIKDQFYLLILEPRCAEILYALLLEKIFSVELREKTLKLLVNILKTDRVYEKSKLRLNLHEMGFQGLLCLMQGQTSSLEMTHLLTDIILSRDHINGYTGAMALAYSLAEENLEIKLEFTKRLLGYLLSRPNAPVNFVKQTSWQECVARLLIKKPITAQAGIKPMVQNLIDLDVEAATYGQVLTPTPATTPSSPSKVPWPVTPGLGLSATLEQDIKDVAESVSNLVAGAVTGNLSNIAIATGNLQNAAEVLTDGLTNAAGSLHTNLHSAVNSAYSLFRQKTLQVQGSLEELGENTIQRLKRRSQSAQGSALDAPTGDTTDCAATSNQSSPALRYRFLGAPLEMAVDALNLDPAGDDDLLPKKRESSMSVSSRASAPAFHSKNLNDFAPYENLDTETYTLISEVSGQWSGLVLDPSLDPEEDLCSTILSIYLVLLWRGIPGSSKEDWRERSQILSCINLLGLNNELYRSHLEIKRRLIEMILQAGLNEFKIQSSNNPGRNTNVITNCQQAIRWVYDLVVLDPHEDETKKMSVKLLELSLSVFEALNVFQDAEDSPGKRSSEIYHIALALLLRFSSSRTDPELCAMASARLHALVQFHQNSDATEVAFLVQYLNSTFNSINEGKEDGEEEVCYSAACLIPILKAVLEKAAADELQLDFPQQLASLALSNSPNFSTRFRQLNSDDKWKSWMDEKVRGLSERFKSLHLTNLPEVMNRNWAESDEAAMLAVHRRNREVNESKIKFQVQILDAFRSRQAEENARYNAQLSHRRGHALLIRKKWRQLKQFLVGPRGSWAHRVSAETFWKLSPCENRSRMRLKLVPNPHYDPHIQASRLRDNTGAQDLHSPDSLNCLLPSNVANQALKRALNAEEPEDSLTEEDLALAASLEKEELSETGNSGKVTTSEDCELVTLLGVIKGRLEISRGWICFWDSGLAPSGATAAESAADRERADFKFALGQLQEVHLRRYNLRRSALEFFLTDHSNYFVNFTVKTRNRIYSRVLSLRPPNLLYHSSRSPADVLRSSGLTQRWVQREITNFDYLMQLNTIAGRTYNDLSQYPVFPWILADYQSKELDLTNPATFRDLSRPIGVVNPKNAKEVKAKYENFEDPSGTIAKFHYGTHYSNAAGVLHYLVRMEPFTSLHIELQSGRFDVADRQFHSLASTWRLLMDNPNDVKELIPEFFCSPEFLINSNKLDLGVLQGSRQAVGDVELPPWASSPQDFIEQHRKALESDHVSANLHRWIDLIFGHAQRGPAAVEALNVFYYCSYDGAVDLDAISDPIERLAVEGMINHFGQTPVQLFKEPHPARMSQSEASIKSKYPPSIQLYFDRLSCVHIADLTGESTPQQRLDWIVRLSIPNSDPDPTRSRGYGYATSAVPDILVSVSRSGIVGLHPWASHDKILPNGFSLERDPTVTHARNRRKIGSGSSSSGGSVDSSNSSSAGSYSLLHPSVQLNNRIVCVSSDCKWLFVGGQLDNSVKVYSLPRLKLAGSSSARHIDIVTCLALDEGGGSVGGGGTALLMTGSRDTTCAIWEVSPTGALKSVQVLYGHDKPVTCLGLSASLDMAVSGSLDGSVNVHTVKEGQYIRTLNPSSTSGPSIVSHLWLSERGDVVFSAEEKDNYSIHAYTINGLPIGLSHSPYPFTAITSGGEGNVICGDANGDVTIRRVLGLIPMASEISMQSPIEDLILAPRGTQLLVALKDGKVVIVAPNLPLI